MERKQILIRTRCFFRVRNLLDWLVLEIPVWNHWCSLSELLLLLLNLLAFLLFGFRLLFLVLLAFLLLSLFNGLTSFIQFEQSVFIDSGHVCCGLGYSDGDEHRPNHQHDVHQYCEDRLEAQIPVFHAQSSSVHDSSEAHVQVDFVDKVCHAGPLESLCPVSGKPLDAAIRTLRKQEEEYEGECGQEDQHCLRAHVERDPECFVADLFCFWAEGFIIQSREN